MAFPKQESNCQSNLTSLLRFASSGVGAATQGAAHCHLSELDLMGAARAHVVVLSALAWGASCSVGAWSSSGKQKGRRVLCLHVLEHSRIKRPAVASFQNCRASRQANLTSLLRFASSGVECTIAHCRAAAAELVQSQVLLGRMRAADGESGVGAPVTSRVAQLLLLLSSSLLSLLSGIARRADPGQTNRNKTHF